ncbi:MAG: helix-hairpin-helix domain-containing protein [Calditrichae bacterium]|nr:helix-hairpin-helix domain-containing protein [Calditrichota bacterium]MCB9057496.1 helix-hairpin-helix domain-containing protein [Calditrichia bacterium]
MSLKKYQSILKIFAILSVLSGFLFAQETIYSSENQLDINNASLEEIQGLPVSADLAQRIYNRLTYRGDFKNIYDLRKIEGIDQALFNTLKPLIRVEPFRELSSTQQRIEDVYYQLDRWSGNEGTNDAFIDLWIEKILEPLNVNSARYDELINLQNISPVDAVAIINYRNDTGGIRGQRDLRGIPGLSYYGYSNASNFVDYSESALIDEEKFHGHITVRMDNTPFMTEEGDVNQEIGLGLTNLSSAFYQGVNTQPNQYIKSRFTYDQKYKFGFSFNRYLGEPVYYYKDTQIPKMKFFAGVENIKWGDIELRKAYLGNYSVTFGQGVIMENTDFFVPRKSGFGFRKRFNGITGDNSQTREFALRGIAAEVGYKNFSATGFVSYNDRDAILNKQVNDSTLGNSFSQFIILDQRFRYAPDDASRLPDQSDLPWLDAVTELTYGGHLQYDFMPGTWLGLTYYESAYNRYLDPNPEEITADDNWTARQVTTDTEIKQSYGGPISRGTNPFWDDAVSFRRIYGFDFQATIENLALMGEYGELDKGGNFFKMGDDPKALVLSAYLQYPSFNMLALYRNYDVGYDNPYQRSFSNYRRFKGTIFEDYYYLESALYGQLYTNAAQPQAEEGFYLNSFYQISRELTTRFEYDNWTRNADKANQYRLVGTLDYRPVFPLQIQLRQKWQARDEENDITLRYFKSLEFRGRIRARLSNFNDMTLFYANGKTLVHPRPRVFGDIVLDGEAFGAGMTHNFNNNLKLSASLFHYQGFFWNFEDTQFVVMESTRGALRYWLSLYMRLNSFVSMRMKYTGDFQQPVQNIVFDPNTVERVRKHQNLFYLEFNYNF